MTDAADGPADDRLAILGVGVMGETLLAGLLEAGWRADQIVVTDSRTTADTVVARFITYLKHEWKRGSVSVWGCILDRDGKSFSPLLVHTASDSLARLFNHVSGSLTGTVLV